MSFLGFSLAEQATFSLA